MSLLKFDMPESFMYLFQDPASPTMTEIIHFHNFVMIYLTFIIVAISWVMLCIINRFNKSKSLISHKYFIHGSLVEIVWTIAPAIILVTIAFPSFKLLYLIDEVIDPAITIKIVGHQWYWSYEYSDYIDNNGETISMDSYIVREDDLTQGQLRLLEVDNRLVVPVNTHVRLIITAADVLHCWAVPSLGIKLDAVPGRLNQTSLLASREGVFYGMCSEICGFGHQGMPIVVESVSLPNYCAHIDTLLKG